MYLMLYDNNSGMLIIIAKTASGIALSVKMFVTLETISHQTSCAERKAVRVSRKEIWYVLALTLIRSVGK